MKRLYLPFYLFAIILIFGACESGDEFDDEFTLNGTFINMADIAGSWAATQAVFTNFATNTTVDVVADGGSVSLTIQSDGRFTVTVSVVGEAPEVSTGRMGFDEDLLVIAFDDEPEEWEFFSIMHNEPTLSISGGNGLVTFDFDNDGIEEAAFIDFIFDRI